MNQGANTPSYTLDAPGVYQLQDMVFRVLSLTGALAFVILIVILVVGGIKFLTSGGEQKAVASAQQTLTWGVLGIVLLASSWLVLRLIQAFTGANVMDFCLLFSGCA